jgi:hypothetical protein
LGLPMDRGSVPEMARRTWLRLRRPSRRRCTDILGVLSYRSKNTQVADLVSKTNISDLKTLNRSQPTPTRARSVRIPPRMDLPSKKPACRPNRDARHDAPDMLTDTSPAFRPLFAHGLRQRTSVIRSARAAPRSAGASTRTGVGLGGSPPATASSSGRVSPSARRS